jgi:hypothetical protein
MTGEVLGMTEGTAEARAGGEARAGLRRRLSSRPVAFAFGGLALAVTIAAIPLLSLSHQWGGGTAATLPASAACLAVGLILSVKRSDNPMGWILLGVSLFFALNSAASSYDVLDYHLHAGSLPGGAISVLVQPSWAPGIILFATTALLFPDGRFASRVAKWATLLLLGVGAVWLAGAVGITVQTIADHAIKVTGAGTLVAINNPKGAWAWWSVAQTVFFFTAGACVIVWLVQMVARLRRAVGDERLQLKWLISGVTVAVVGGALAVVGTGPAIFRALRALGALATVALPVSLAVAVMRFRLYDIDRLVSRTVSYVVVSGVTVGAYVGVVTLTSKAIGFSSPIAVATSTLVAAAIFNPVRKRVQRVVDQRFNRSRYDAERMVAHFAGRLREEVDPYAVRGYLEEAVRTSLEPATLSVWVNPTRPSG